MAQSAFGVELPPEDGLTFVENAIAKARHAAERTGRPALADDSGLVVDALGGAPGIHSARYAGLDGGDAANNEKLLHALAGVPEEERTRPLRVRGGVAAVPARSGAAHRARNLGGEGAGSAAGNERVRLRPPLPRPRGRPHRRRARARTQGRAQPSRAGPLRELRRLLAGTAI